MLCQVHNDEAVNFFKNELKTSSKLVAVDYYMYSYFNFIFFEQDGFDLFKVIKYMYVYNMITIHESHLIEH